MHDKLILAMNIKSIKYTLLLALIMITTTAISMEREVAQPVHTINAIQITDHLTELELARRIEEEREQAALMIRQITCQQRLLLQLTLYDVLRDPAHAEDALLKILSQPLELATLVELPVQDRPMQRSKRAICINKRRQLWEEFNTTDDTARKAEIDEVMHQIEILQPGCSGGIYYGYLQTLHYDTPIVALEKLQANNQELAQLKLQGTLDILNKGKRVIESHGIQNYPKQFAAINTKLEETHAQLAVINDGQIHRA